MKTKIEVMRDATHAGLSIQNDSADIVVRLTPEETLDLAIMLHHAWRKLNGQSVTLNTVENRLEVNSPNT